MRTVLQGTGGESGECCAIQCGECCAIEMRFAAVCSVMFVVIKLSFLIEIIFPFHELEFLKHFRIYSRLLQNDLQKSCFTRKRSQHQHISESICLSMLTREHQIWELTPKTNRFLSLRTIRELQRLRQHDNYLMHSDEVWRRQLKAFCTNEFPLWFSIRSVLLLLNAFHATANTEPEYCEDDSIISLSILIFRYEVFIIKREIQSIVRGKRFLSFVRSYEELSWKPKARPRKASLNLAR